VNAPATGVLIHDVLTNRGGNGGPAYVVDVDGISPVYFKNVDAGNFTIAIRHRNHLGLSTDPSSTSSTLSEKTTTALVDMSIYTDAQLFGTATVNYTVVNGINMLYAGNVSGNGFVRYQGTNGPGATNVSDRVALLSDLGNNELNTLNTYQRGDVSMNGVTRYQGTNGPGANNVSDRVFILGTVLGNNDDLQAYDVCVFNQAINFLAAKLGLPFDDEGKLAAIGKEIPHLRTKLEAIPFLHKKGPKSLGREDFWKDYQPLLSEADILVEDALHTFTHFAAQEIARHIPAHTKVLVTGGGAWNTYFIDALNRYAENVSIEKPDATTINFKEAIVFAWLGYQRLQNKPTAISMVTGAKTNSSGGAIWGNTSTLFL
jgi:hypothetical protein